MKNNFKLRIVIVIALLIIVGVFVYYQKYIQKDKVIKVVNQTNGEIINSVTFNCSLNKNIKSVFYKDKVDIVLSDGRSISLPQVISGSGARYANTDESFVFLE